MAKSSEFLIAIMNNENDFKIARDQHWYRIPVHSAKKWIEPRWPPKWVGFYFTKSFKAKKHAIYYFAEVLAVKVRTRQQLFPNEPFNAKSPKSYYQIMLGPLQELPNPIFSKKWRRITFISTTWEKVINAAEINDLFDGSPLEDRLWARLKQLEILAERQKHVTVGKTHYFLDFAIYCARGNLNIETDGDTYHKNDNGKDNSRNNDLEKKGWAVLRFDTNQIIKDMDSYTIPTIIEKINQLGGVDEGNNIFRRIDLKKPGSSFQYSLFDPE